MLINCIKKIKLLKNKQSLDARLWLQKLLLRKSLNSLKYYSLSIHIAIPMPPPMHKGAKAFFEFLLTIS